MKIAFFSTKSYDRKYFDLYKDSISITYFETQLNENSVDLIQNESVVCGFVNDVLNAKVIAALAQKGVKLIALRSAGFNNVDVQAAKTNGIKIVRVPAYSPNAVAEHAVALLLTLNRKTHKAYNRVREGNFSIENLEGFDLYQKTVGVIGTGKIGQIFIKIMQGFGCNVIAYDLVQNSALIGSGVKYVALNELFSQSDIISLHCPLNDATKYIINQKSLEMMKKGVFVVNTGRGALLNTKDVIDKLKTGKIGGLALDVYEQEGPLFFSDHSSDIIQDEVLMRLMTFPNVLVTSHQGFFTKEALTQIAKTTIQNIEDVVNVGKSGNEVV